MSITVSSVEVADNITGESIGFFDTYSSVAGQTIPYNTGIVCGVKDLKTLYVAKSARLRAVNDSNTLTINGGVSRTYVAQVSSYPSLYSSLLPDGIAGGSADVIFGTSTNSLALSSHTPSSGYAGGTGWVTGYRSITVTGSSVDVTGSLAIPNFIHRVSVIIIGGGGGGGSGGGGVNWRGGGGGGAGASVYIYDMPVVPGSTLNITAGKYGAGATGSSNDGGAGGASSITCTANGSTLSLVSCAGGGGGIKGIANQDSSGTGGTGGVVTKNSNITCNNSYTGGRGGNRGYPGYTAGDTSTGTVTTSYPSGIVISLSYSSSVQSTTEDIGKGGSGGASMNGTGGSRGANVTTAGTAGTGYGCGGGGGTPDLFGPGLGGGNGSPGFVWVQF